MTESFKKLDEMIQMSALEFSSIMGLRKVTSIENSLKISDLNQ